MRTYDWWIEWEDVVEMLQHCCKNATNLSTYLIETFKLEIPCRIILHPIVEEVYD